MKKLPNGGETNSDGSKSGTYCGYCCENGKFLQPDINAAQMQDFVKGKMKEMGFPGFLAGFFTKGIPKLERWQKS